MMKNNTKILIIVISLHLLLQSCNFPSVREKKQKQESPNIIFIFADDQSFRTLQAHGNDEIKTPHIDQLAQNGTLFTHAYNMGGWNGAICVASRAMIMTGSFIWNAYAYEQEYKNADQPLSRSLWGNLMQEAGYKTYMTGKWHIKRSTADVFDHIVNERPGMPATIPESYNRPQGPSDTTWLPWKKELGGFWEGGKHWSEVLGDDGIAFIDSAKEKNEPFFMYLAFNAPHDPRQSPKEFVEKYPLDAISVPETFLPVNPYAKEMGMGVERDEKLAPYPRTEYAVKIHRQEYYAIISHMDQQIGRIVNALKESGKADNTYIIFTADHGLAVGEHGLMGKQNMFDHSLRVPFIITGPDIPANKRIDADLYLQDAMATCLELAGLDKPEYIDFHSVMDLIRGSRTESYYDAIYGSFNNYQGNSQRMIRKNGYKLIVYPVANKMLLFDLNSDPLEMNDLSELPEYQEKKKKMFNELVELQREMKDTLDLKVVFAEI